MSRKPSSIVIGAAFGRLTIIAKPFFKTIGGKRKSFVRVVCSCGNEKTVNLARLKHGTPRSCGCLRSELLSERQSTQWGLSHSKEGMAWHGMIYRCYTPSSKHYHNYGGRGITVCERWRHSLLNFISDVGLAPSKNMTLDRIDNNANYEPGNVRWATRKQQTDNRRICRSYEINGVKDNLKNWCRKYNISYSTVLQRVDKYKMPILEALTARVRSCKGSDNGISKLTEADIPKIRKMLSDGHSQTEIARMYGISKYPIACIQYGTTWKHVK